MSPLGLLISWATPETSVPSEAILSAWISRSWWRLSSSSALLRSITSRASSAVRASTRLCSVRDQRAVAARIAKSGSRIVAPYLIAWVLFRRGGSCTPSHLL